MATLNGLTGTKEKAPAPKTGTLDADTLTAAIDAVDLPSIVAELYPKSGARSGRADLVRAEWRGDEHPSFSLFRSSNGIWMFKDHATGDSGNAWHFLTVIAQMARQEAAETIMKRVGANPPRVQKSKPDREARPEPLNCEALPVPKAKLDEILWKFEEGLTDDMRKRGFIETDAPQFSLMADGDEAVFPIYDPRGVVVGIKRRLGPNADMRYKYEVSKHGSPAWCNPRFQESGRVLVVEGELNAMIAASVLHEHVPNGKISVMGVAGANNSMHAWALEGREVYIYADGNKVGQEARDRWAAQAKEAGADTVYALAAPADDRDFCDVAGQDGRTALFKHISELLRTAQMVYAPTDRTIGYYTIRELNEAMERYLEGNILVPTGYQELDAYTQGLPESGIIGIGALPSMGKSVFLRDIMLNYLEADKSHKAMLFSPDQSVPSIMRLFASRRSGIPAWRVRAGNMTSAILDKHGSVEKARKFWRDAYDDTVMGLTKRFLVSEESDLGDVKKAMLKAIDEGVTMFGGDYLQMFEAETSRGDEIDGKAIKDFKKFCREHKVPMLFAVQLAKYKFDRNRRSGVPYSSDIEGSGKIFQQSEMFFMLYCYHLYVQEYTEKDIVDAAGEYQRLPDGGHAPKTRVYIRKNKEGKRNEYRYLVWDAEIPAFRNFNEPIVTPGSTTQVHTPAVGLDDF